MGRRQSWRMGLKMKRGEVWNVLLDPTKGSEQQGIRPAVIVSPDSMNESLDTKVVIPLTTKANNWPSRVKIEFNSKDGQAMCEQIRTVSSKRLVKNLGQLADGELIEVMSTIAALYSKI
jgi:mRNA interferase MazF